MISQFINHLWQSTLFVMVAGLLTLAFHRNRARVRYWLWFSASLKFLVPFSLLIALGGRVNWAPAVPSVEPTLAPSVSLAIAEISEPVPDVVPVTLPARASRQWVPMAILGIWALGFSALGLVRLRGWCRVRDVLRSSIASDVPAAVEVRYAPGLLEPGVVGLWRTTLLLPAGITEYLTQAQLDAVLAHELCHVRRRDNLWASIHMVVEMIFWFHPLVWWIGARLLEERERACDEEVLSLGGEPRVYAEGIVAVCKLYVESPLACVSGVTGSNLKKRIEGIMANRILLQLNFAKKAALALAGITTLALPILIGVSNAPRLRAQSTSAGTSRFETASIQQGCSSSDVDRKTGASGPAPGAPISVNPLGSPGLLNLNCVSVSSLVRAAYGTFASGSPLPEGSPLRYVGAVSMSGGPPWVYTDQYHIQAKASGDASQEMMLGPMMQALLEERFNLKVHRETRRVPAYALTVAVGGPKMQPYRGDCISNTVFPPLPAGQKHCWEIAGGDNQEPGFSPHFAPESGVQNLDEFSLWLFVMTDRPVLNKTAIPGRFFLHFNFAPDQSTPGALNRLAAVARRNGGNAGSTVPSNPPGPSIFQALQQQLGLQLEAATASRDFLMVEHAEKPSSN